MLISLQKSETIETAQSFESNFIAHHLTIVPFFLYAIYSIHNPKDVTIFLICRNIVSVIYNTRMGQILEEHYRRRVMSIAYILLFAILLANFGVAYLFQSGCRQEMILIIMILSMFLIYLAEKNYNNMMRKEPHISFN